MIIPYTNGGYVDTDTESPSRKYIDEGMARWRQAQGYGFFVDTTGLPTALVGAGLRESSRLYNEFQSANGGLTIQQQSSIDAAVSSGDLTPNADGSFSASPFYAADLAMGHPRFDYIPPVILLPPVSVVQPLVDTSTNTLGVAPIDVGTVYSAPTPDAVPIFRPVQPPSPVTPLSPVQPPPPGSTPDIGQPIRTPAPSPLSPPTSPLSPPADTPASKPAAPGIGGLLDLFDTFLAPVSDLGEAPLGSTTSTGAGIVGATSTQKRVRALLILGAVALAVAYFVRRGR